MDYYQTWSKQNGQNHFEITDTDTAGYKTPSGYIFDLSSCSYHLSFGLRNTFFENVMIDQIKTLPIAGPKTIYSLKDETTKNLLEAIDLDVAGKIFYTTSGAESVENALKIARSFSGKKHVLARKISYHGATTGALSVTGDWRRENQVILSDYTHFIPEPSDIDSIAKTQEMILSIGPDNIAALILETITGGNGVHIPSQMWWDDISKLCKKYNILLILDEVVCGFSRTGTTFGYQNFNMKPDIVCMAKAISAGLFPFGAVYTSEEIANHFKENILVAGLTNYAHPIGLRLCNEVINYIKQSSFQSNLKEVITTLAEYKKRFETCPNVLEVRHLGGLMAVEMKHRNLNFKSFLDNGIYLNVTGSNLIICPPLTSRPKDLAIILEKVLKIIKE